MLSYGLTVFLSAFLLFQVELIIAKYILPWFGGTPAVWTTCMLFFQVLLLLGYAYSHWVVKGLTPGRQGRLHLALLAGSVCLLIWQQWSWQAAVLPPARWKPAGSDYPVFRILGLLSVAVGLPFFILSATSSLLQAWFARAHPGRSPYPLYALSNAGSLLALLSYPFLVEPTLSLWWQAGAWWGGYVVFVLCCGWCAAVAARAKAGASAEPTGAGEEPSAAAGEERPADRSDAEPRPRWVDRWLWLALSAFSCTLLLATTNVISEEVAVIPFLWVVPLSVYLLTFIICFGGRWGYFRRPFVAAALLLLTAAALVMQGVLEDIGLNEVAEWIDDAGIVWEISAYMVALFVCCMICHGELARLKPAPRHLTSFYLSIAAGGALGGVFVAVLAPRVFNGLWELYVGYFGCAAALVVVMARDKRSWLNGRARWLWRAVATAALTALAVVPYLDVAKLHEGAIRVERNFYGILRVTEEHPDRPEWHNYYLAHAGTVHGFQYRRPDLRDVLTSYYTEESGVGLAILYHPRRSSDDAALRIGAVGLGTGTIAAYGWAGDYFRFYEINPAVVELADGPTGEFTFLRDSRADGAEIEVVLGDARISMEHELERNEAQKFDVLVLDAFSGDSPPVHLLTQEAFDIYLRHLGQGGILAAHISNRYVDLEPVVWRLADELGIGCVLIDTEEDGHASGATWMLLTHDEEFLQQEAVVSAATPRDDSYRSIRLWTDDYSNLFQILR